MITVWGRKSSSNVQAVMWCIEELKLPYERIDAGFKYGVVDTDAYRAMNPNGTVPTIQDGDNAPLWESGAILRYLASQYGKSGFWPDCLIERAKVDQWAEWSKINVAQMFTGPIFWRVARTPVSRQDPDAIAKAIEDFELSLEIADRQLQVNPYIAGKSFSLADIQFAHILYRYYDIPIQRKSFAALKKYYDRISVRSSYKLHVALSYAELIDTK